MRFISDNLVELNLSEADTIHRMIGRASARTSGVSDANRLEGAQESLSFASRELDITAGLKLASILHRGKIHASVLAGVVSETISAIVQEGERIINEGDIERGRALAQRNFEADPESAIEKALGENDLNFIVATLAKARANGENGMFVGLTADTVSEMTEEALTDWTTAMRASLVAIGNERVARGQKPDDLSVQAAFAHDAAGWKAAASSVIESVAAANAVAQKLATGAVSAILAKPKRKTAARKRTPAKAKLGASGRGAKAVLRSRK